MPNSPGETLKRVNACLAQFYDPDFDAETKAAVREEFVRALMPYPQWAVHEAFDAWARTMQRRPSPAEIIILVGRALKPITDELSRRAKIEAEMAEAKTRVELTPDEMERRRKLVAELCGQSARHMDGQTTERRQDVSPGEIEATLALIRENEARRQAEAERRKAVAIELASNGLDGTEKAGQA